MIAWWNSLSIDSQIFYCVALPATLILLVQTVLLFFGIGDEGDGAPETDYDAADIGEGDLEGESLSQGMDGLRLFTLRGVVAFFVTFGWVGVIACSGGLHIALSALIATASGFVVMLLLALILRAVMRLKNDGNIDNRNAVGVCGRVQLRIPAKRQGEGKVHVMIQGSYVEREALTDEQEDILTGAEIIVVGVSGGTTLVVKRK